uniref:SCAN box domain-containing protein n=1 Tax=Knipowitschia caucasica TaxID=637954 RepID=A0AAV2K2M5_KNICA
MAEIANLLQGLVRKQTEHDAKWEQEKLQQENRWQSMERRVDQLQQEVKAELPDTPPVMVGAAPAAQAKSPNVPAMCRDHQDVVPVIKEDELQLRMKDLYEKWITPRDKSKEQIGDAIVLEQFLRVLNSDLRTWIKERNPSSSREAAEFAEAFLSARRSFKSSLLTRKLSY